MKKKKQKTTNKEIEAIIWNIINKYQKVLLLQRHNFAIHYGTDNPNAIAECECNYPYLNVIINYSDKLIEKFDKGIEIEQYIVHEMCHIITDPFYCKATQVYKSKGEIEHERELLTDYICNIVLNNKL